MGKKKIIIIFQSKKFIFLPLVQFFLTENLHSPPASHFSSSLQLGLGRNCKSRRVTIKGVWKTVWKRIIFLSIARNTSNVCSGRVSTCIFYRRVSYGFYWFSLRIIIGKKMLKKMINGYVPVLSRGLSPPS